MALIGFVGLCLLVAAADTALTETGMRVWYPTLRHPPGTPPDWVFPVVWIPLYLAMAVAAWRVWRPTMLRFRIAAWTPVFFGLHRPGPALAVIAGLAGLVALTLRDFRHVDRWAALLMAPYLAWVCYAFWLNAGIAWMNPA